MNLTKVYTQIKSSYRKYVKWWNCSIYFITFIIIFALYQTGSFYSDDLTYMNAWGSDKPLHSLSEIIVFQQRHYLHWGGRTVAHTILQLLFLAGKPLSAIINTLGYIILAYMIMKLSIKKFSIFAHIGILGLLYFMNPTFEETIMWYTGNANYMWTTLLILLAISPFIKLLENKGNSTQHWWALPLAFLAGWTNENMAPTMLLTMIIIVIYHYRKTGILEIWSVSSVFLAGAGCILLILAPGNYFRTSVLAKGIMAILYRGHGEVNALCNWLLIPFILLAFSFWLLYRSHLKIHISSVVFSAWSVISILVMAVSPSYPMRATFGSFVLILISFLTNLNQYLEFHQKDAIFVRLVSIALWIGIMGTFVSLSLLAYVRDMGIEIPG